MVAGKNLEAAVYATEELEETAKLYLLLRSKNPQGLTPEQVAETVAAVAEELAALETGATLIEQLMARRGA